MVATQAGLSGLAALVTGCGRARGIGRAARCFPVVAQATGCSVCMKVCPVQRYGLAAVLDEYKRSGRILGEDRDELEGYRWPLDGRHYGPGTRPFLDAGFFEVPGFGALAGDGRPGVADNPLM